MFGRYNGTTITEGFIGGIGAVIVCRPADVVDWGALQRLLRSLEYGAGGFGDSAATIAWVGGDTQDGDTYNQAEMLDMVIREQNLEAGAIASDAFALTGDYTAAGSEAQYIANTALLAAIADATWLDSTKPPLLAALGDDDDDTVGWAAFRDAALPGQAAVRGEVQYFLHETANVSWIVLDVAGDLAVQATWLTATALPAVAKGIVIVLCHKLPYSLSTWPPDTTELLQIIAALEGATNCDPVLICGHAHVYSRWRRMLLGVRDDVNGILYLNAGRTAAFDAYNPDLTRVDDITYGERTDHVVAADVGAASIEQTIFGIIRVQLVSGGYVLKHYNIDLNGTATLDDTSPIVPI